MRLLHLIIGLLVLFGRASVSAAQTRTPVPPQAPDTLPAGLYAESNIRHNSVCIVGPVLKDIIVLMFKPGTPQEQRQAVVDLVQGEVIGGRNSAPVVEGDYYIRIEDDGTGERLCQAIDQLNALPQVLGATHGVLIPERELPPPIPWQELAAKAPVFTPYHIHPRLKNEPQVAHALAALPPASLQTRDAIELSLLLLLDEAGRVRRVVIRSSSGSEYLDRETARLLGSASFTPAQRCGERGSAVPVAVWTGFVIEWTADEVRLPVAPEARCV